MVVAGSETRRSNLALDLPRRSTTSFVPSSMSPLGSVCYAAFSAVSVTVLKFVNEEVTKPYMVILREHVA